MNKSIFVVMIGSCTGLLIAATTATIIMVAPSQTMASTGCLDDNSSDSCIHWWNKGTEHINQAQNALQNGDIEGAQNHLDLAKQNLGNFHPWPP